MLFLGPWPCAPIRTVGRYRTRAPLRQLLQEGVVSSHPGLDFLHAPEESQLRSVHPKLFMIT
jgi:hypothetical protein